MRTARSLSASHSIRRVGMHAQPGLRAEGGMHAQGGMHAGGRVCAWGDVHAKGVGGMHAYRACMPCTLLPVDRQTPVKT